jgi:signal peptidase I
METNAVFRAGKDPVPERKPPGLGGALFLALFAALGMKFFLFDFMIVEGRSMLPALRPGTVLLINRAAYGFKLPGTHRYLVRWSRPEVGDVVVFYTPRGDTAVKRCGEITEDREIIVLGDNDLESFDSRSYGPIPENSILGKVVGVR